MELQTVYFISQVVAAIALIASLVFVGLQVRLARKQSEHAEKTSRAQVHQKIAESFREIALEWGRRTVTFQHMMKDTKTDDLSVEERMDFGVMLYPTLKVGENAYFQWENGLLSKVQLDFQMTLILNILGSSVARDWWAERSKDFYPQFVEYLDGAIGQQRSFRDFEIYQVNGIVSKQAGI